ncbi:P-loop NTPase family protein [Hespellia stercorisuis]|uniref:ABC transporter n=1 Tax=Hespellia stercorisuis DSM 15480 TaxID=1121950 RepID=A0A1M6PI16_9FIRM|nr:hypothetical protein [Hespellia stercorisuis]SHK07598.1 hypothetical protein SAMN02745243_02135 [Hespellia stercorisuis DSM 15480]
MNVLEIYNLKKVYGNDKNTSYALNDITFSMEGGVFGLLGHNGAGKITLVKGVREFDGQNNTDCGHFRMTLFFGVRYSRINITNTHKFEWRFYLLCVIFIFVWL